MKKYVFIFFCLIPAVVFGQQIIEKEITDWEFRMVGDSVWKKAKVPGTIIDNFVDLGDISNPQHPYYGDNEKLYQWIGENDWEFKTTVNIEPAYQESEFSLQFGALDLFAEVYVDGRPHSSQNALKPFNVYSEESYWDDHAILEDKLDIRIVFRSTIDSLKKMMRLDSLKYPGEERVYGRTAQYQFGWDWGPKFINMGIRKPVKLSVYPNDYIKFSAYISDLKIEKDVAWFYLNFNLVKSKKKKSETYHLDYTLYLNEKKLEHINTPLFISFSEDNRRRWVIEHPKLWWPNGMMDGPHYYTLDLKLTPIEDTTKVIAQYKFNYAICTTELVQEKDKYGESFYFKINGEKGFAKGANYIPDDSFHPGKNTSELVRLAKEANMNMIRVWGGGNYPDDEFYDECMKNGIMVWQDFMYACAMYPINPEFTYNAEEEALYQTNRLQNYNNIVVWCGNNENDEGWKNWGWQKEFHYSAKDSTDIWNGHLDLFHNMLKYASQVTDTSSEYIYSSPKHGWGRKESMTEGDSHYWGVWWGLEPIEKYNEKVPRFMSEFGMQAMPDLSTLKKVIPDSAMNFHSPKFKNHQKHPTGFQTLHHYLKEYLVVPNNMEDYAYATQILQAYALTTAIEAQRRAMPYCMGSLIWQLNDCWPVVSWSLVDYELKKKMSYYAVKKAFEPVLVSMKEETTSFDLYVVNEENENLKSNLFYCIRHFTGDKIIEKKYSFSIKKQSSAKVISIPKETLKGLDLTRIYMEVSIGIGKESQIPYTFFHFTKLNKLQLPKPVFEVKSLGRNMYQLSSDVYTPFVYIEGANVKGSTLTKNQGIMFESETEIRGSQIKCLNNLLND
jgi:beta-mannosidase